MEIKWTNKALSDLARLYDFLAFSQQASAAGTVQSVTMAPHKLIEYPRLGEKLEEFDPREVRRIIVGHYELRYEIQTSTIFILRLWHTKETR